MDREKRIVLFGPKSGMDWLFLKAIERLRYAELYKIQKSDGLKRLCVLCVAKKGIWRELPLEFVDEICLAAIILHNTVTDK